MSMKLLQERFATYRCLSTQDEDHAVKEISQELILHALYNAGFFKYAAFQGGTCLRIVHGLQRFSEDLDFALLKPNPKFDFVHVMRAIEQELIAFGYQVHVNQRASREGAVQSAFVKADSFSSILGLKYPSRSGPMKSLKIKLEVDISPPIGATSELRFHSYPLPFAINCHDLASLFAGKSHALLARPYDKGRDWFDLLWYLGRKIKPNYEFLASALHQAGPWQGQALTIDRAWYLQQMERRIKALEWTRVKMDIQRFLRSVDAKALESWSSDLFLAQLQQLPE